MTRLPLDGIRILDLSQVYAGPLACRVLADMGAEVIRIESAVRSTRGGIRPQQGAVYPDNKPGERPYNRSAYYNELNRNKLAISLDLSRDQGRELFKKLVEKSDVVLENYSPRVMANFELDYPVLNQVNSKIIMVSISAYGHTGPYRNYVSFGRGIEAMSGLSAITGYSDSQPLGPGMAYADATGGLHAAFAILVALRQRNQTGKGQHIDLSLRESLTALLGEQVLDHFMNGRTMERKGNQDSTTLFQGCYRCRGEDEWIAIAIHSDGEWDAFGNVIGNPLNRWEKPSILREMIEEWTTKHESEEAMHILQQSGVRAGTVLSVQNLTNNPHLRTRGFFQPIFHPEAGMHDHPGMPWKMSSTPARIRTPAPCFAEHNQYVFGELLGMTHDEIAGLKAQGITADVPIR